jgi:hypothetical protein
MRLGLRPYTYVKNICYISFWSLITQTTWNNYFITNFVINISQLNIFLMHTLQLNFIWKQFKLYNHVTCNLEHVQQIEAALTYVYLPNVLPHCNYNIHSKY